MSLRHSGSLFYFFGITEGPRPKQKQSTTNQAIKGPMVSLPSFCSFNWFSFFYKIIQTEYWKRGILIDFLCSKTNKIIKGLMVYWFSFFYSPHLTPLITWLLTSNNIINILIVYNLLWDLNQTTPHNNRLVNSC